MSGKRGHEDAVAGPSGKRIRSQPKINQSQNETQNALVINDPQLDLNRAGKILRVQLRNFMCHSNLVVDFNKRINLVVGHNGSGKSAILTALIVGLGSKASVTSRSKNLQQLIKRGEQSATVEIHISNFGVDAYEPELYGDKIIVTRNIAHSGTSIFKLKSESGTVISSLKSELLKMMLCMNIYVDNPVCVLNQDAARSFLKESDPKKNFQLFLRATQIHAIIEKLDACSVHHKDAKLRLDYQKSVLLERKKAVNETTIIHNELQLAGSYKEELKKLRAQKHWREVKYQEEFCAEIESMVEQSASELNILMQKYQNSDSTENSLREQIEGIANELKVLRLALVRDVKRCDEIQTAFQSKYETYQVLKQNTKKQQDKKQNILQDIQQLENDIAERNESQTDRFSKLKKDNEEKLIELNRKKEDVNAMSANAKRDIQMIINSKMQLEEEFNEMRINRSNILGKIEKLSKDIERLTKSSKDKLLAYGDYMPNLIAAIHNLKKRGEFSEMPRGPLGRYIEITDSRWTSAVESIIGSTMLGFCVNNVKDRQILSNLIKTNFPEARSLAIFTSKFIDQVYDTRHGQCRPIENSKLVMNVIKVSDPIVMNCLIDNCKIETILLTEDGDLAMRLTSGAENVPKNLLKIIVTNPPTEFFPAPNYRMYAMDFRNPRYLQVNTANIKAQLSNEIAQLKNEQDRLERLLSDYQNKLKDRTKSLNDKRQILDRLNGKFSELQEEISDIETMEYPGQSEEEILNTELAELKTLLVRCENECEKLEQNLVDVKKNVAEKEKELSGFKEMIQNQETDIYTKDKEFEDLKQQLVENASNAKLGEGKINRFKADFEKLKVQLTEVNDRKKRLEETAIQYGDRVECDYTDEELAENIKNFQRKMKSIMSRHDNIEDVSRLLETQTKELNQIEVQTNSLFATLRLLVKARNSRYNLVMRIKQHMSLRVQHTFNAVMRLRNFTAELKIDYEKETLEISVVPRDKHIDSAVSNAKCLSGGERSYSTIAFLLSLWSCVDHPFYFLDEYDVFTDQVNRFYMTNLLINEAKKKPHRQYAFLTPQDMSEFTANSTLSILRLSDPERNN